MGLTATERDVLGVITELEVANIPDICERLGFASPNVEYLCRYLGRRNYLVFLGRANYALAPAEIPFGGSKREDGFSGGEVRSKRRTRCRALMRRKGKKNGASG